jgi:hypothetical protein
MVAVDDDLFSDLIEFRRRSVWRDIARRIAIAAGVVLLLIAMMAAGFVLAWYEAGAQVEQSQQRNVERGWRARIRRRPVRSSPLTVASAPVGLSGIFTGAPLCFQWVGTPFSSCFKIHT